MAEAPVTGNQFEEVASKVLDVIDRPREREVVERRFGLTGAKETLESVGETLGITRERVRQIEKATLIRAKISLDDGKNPAFDAAEVELVKSLHELNRAARIEVLADKLLGSTDIKSRGIVSLLAELSEKTVVTSENDRPVRHYRPFAGSPGERTGH